METLRIIGIDPGTRITGWGIVEKRGSTLVHVDNGAIHTSSKDSLAVRLKQIHEGLDAVIQEHRPVAAGLETVFVGRNVSSALKLGHARGVAMLAASNHGLEVTEYSPQTVKRAVVGTGRADKRQVQEMVRIILGLPEIAQEDASDALAVAICRCQSLSLTLPLESGRRATPGRRR